ncbi:MAG: DUF4123 domain-containing protein, partial [Phycisphaerales bacterium]
MVELAAQSELLQVEPITLDDLRALAAEGRLYAVIDACDADPVPEKMQELGASDSDDDPPDARAVCLYRGDSRRDFFTFAPFLAHVDEALLDWIADTLWAEPWGIFLVAGPHIAPDSPGATTEAAHAPRTATFPDTPPAPSRVHPCPSAVSFDAIRRHLRKFLKVKSPEGKTLYFRYYDPRILAAFLPACNEQELRQLFGPLESFITAGAWSGEEQIMRHTFADVVGDT